MDKKYYAGLCDETAHAIARCEVPMDDDDAVAVTATLAAISVSIMSNKERDPRLLGLTISETISKMRAVAASEDQGSGAVDA